MNERRLKVFLAVCVLTALLASPAWAGKNKGGGTVVPAAPPNTITGSAFGVYYDIDLLGENLAAGPTPLVVIPAGGGAAANTVFTLEQPGLISAPTITVVTSGTVGPTHANADSVAIIEGLGLLDGLIAVDTVVSFSSSVGDGTSATSEANGSGLIGLSIAGINIGNVIPPPNTVIPVPGVGVIIVNEQIKGGDGIKTTALTVNAAHVILHPELTDPSFLEELINLGIIDIELIKGLLGGAVLDLDLLQELRLLGIVDGGLIGLVTTLLGGTIEIGLLESLLGIDLVEALLDIGGLDVLLEDLFPGGLLNLDVLEALLESGELEGVLEFALGSLGVLDGGFLDLTFLESLIDSGILDLEVILDFVLDSEYDLSLPEGEIVLSQAVSGVQFFGPTPPAGTAAFLMHGGGQIAAGFNKAHFGIHVHVPQKKKKGLHGHLHYHDHATGLKVHSHTITSATVDPTRTGVTFTGIASVNGVFGFTFTCTAVDVAKHGRGNDTFHISLQGPGGPYENGGTLTAGSLHMHLGK